MPHPVRQDPGTSPRLFDASWRSATVGAIALMSLISFVYLAVATAMPTAARDLDGLPLYGLAFGGAFAASILCTVLAGGWNDARGPAAPMWTGLVLFAAGLLVAGTAISMPMLIIGRVIQGFGGGLIGVTIYVVVARVYPADLRPKVFAAFAAAWVVPAMVGPSITGVVVTYWGWRWVFLIVPVLAVPAAWLLRTAVRGGRPERPGGAATRGLMGWATAAALAAGLLQFAGQHTGNMLGLLLVPALLALAVAVPRLLPPGTIRSTPGLPTIIGMRGLVSGAFAGAEVFLPLLLTLERGLSPVGVGVGISIGALAWSVGSWWQGRDGLSLTRVQVLRYGAASLTLGVALVTLLVLPQVPFGVGWFGWLLSGLGMGLIYPTLSTLTLDQSDPGEQGRNAAALRLSETLFMTVVVTLTGSLFAILLPLDATLAYLACFTVAMLLAVRALAVAHRVLPRLTHLPRIAAPQR